eukprot:TRINITY_DN9458_c0_g1_i3.p1 TRINITY_DN9458_c0_g1~~TRINITY_DN9458_c0_g1_i3.p1  ORF type:complete len:346 (-),score=39.73 TRINITY_DN9458_c0_g1_i3:131-1168(-)
MSCMTNERLSLLVALVFSGVVNVQLYLQSEQIRGQSEQIRDLEARLGANQLLADAKLDHHGDLIRDLQTPSGTHSQAAHTVGSVRRLAGALSTANTASVTASTGCAVMTSSTDFVYSATPGTGTTNCGSDGTVRCPPCIMAGSHTGITATIQDCSTYEKTSSSGDITDELIEFVFINTDSADALTIQARTGSGTNVGSAYLLGPYESVVAFCYSGGSNRLHFPDNGAYCSAGCDATAPNDRTGTAFTRRLVSTSSIATKLETIGGITSAGTIAGRVFANDPGGAITWGVSGAQTAGFTSAKWTELDTIGGITSAGTIASNVFANNPGGTLSWGSSCNGDTFWCSR